MNLAIAAAVFPVIFLGELPDKTMLASLVLAARGRPGATWLGAAAAFTVHVVLATTIGVLAFRLLPPRVLDAATAMVFLAGAMIAARGARRRPGQPGSPGSGQPPDSAGSGQPPDGAGGGQPPAAQPDGPSGWLPRRRPAGQPGRARGRSGGLDAEQPPGGAVSTAADPSGWRPVLTAFAVIFVAEWGDLTQVLTASLTAQYHTPLSVGTGALLALWSAAAIAVTGGRHLGRLVSDRHLQIVTTVLLGSLAIYATWSALR
jgi:putative Ca2+/H+ antiporter (TMEM165/GDT1 family)